MTVMKIAHGGHETDGLTFLVPATHIFTNLGDGMDGLHRESSGKEAASYKLQGAGEISAD